MNAPFGRSLVDAGGDATFWLPRRSSSFAADVDWNWGMVYWVSVFFFALVTFLLVYFILRYRGKAYPNAPSHNTPLEVTWTVIPTLIVIVMFWNGYKTYLDMATPPQNAYEIQVTGQKWNWMFTYPNGYVDAELHVPVDTPIMLVMSSQDVIHSLFVPEFRVKRDVIPGRYTKLWFTAIEKGTFDIFCAEYCGTKHSQMLSKAIVHDRGEFDAWLAEASDFLKRMPPAEAGELLYSQRGCKQCHSVDGVAGTGPSFLGVYGSAHALVGGEQIVVDENYVRESILLPQAKIVAGYEPVMPTYKGRLKDEEISAIIEYLKTLSN
jgi:cytochrome c oxidase subunit 2